MRTLSHNSDKISSTILYVYTDSELYLPLIICSLSHHEKKVEEKIFEMRMKIIAKYFNGIIHKL